MRRTAHEFAGQSQRKTRSAICLAAVDEPLVSIDFKGDTHSSSVDLPFTLVLGGQGNMLKVVSWYDNEWGYSCRTADLVNIVASNR